jgi:hypothetical protein
MGSDLRLFWIFVEPAAFLMEWNYVTKVTVNFPTRSCAKDLVV